ENSSHNNSFADIVRNGALVAYKTEISCTRKDGSPVWVDLTLSFVRDGETSPKYFIAILQDITLRKKAQEDLARLNSGLEERVAARTSELAGTLGLLEKEIATRKETEEKLQNSLSEKEVLLREIHHRVKNNLQIIISLLSLQEMKTRDEASAEALNDSQMRVKSMALVHEKLYQSSDLASIDFSGYLKHLIATMLQSYAVDPAKIRAAINVDGLDLDINRAIPLGLVMSELVSNSLKHAFPAGRSGEITINGRKEGPQYIFTVADNGVGFAPGKDWRKSESLGLRLIATWVKQLRGTVDLESDGMTKFTITVPVGNRGA
ncbi:MAG: histidine kinase dimerization/phosphoacceptor domain -containing protein, partial [Methanoregulaceae archaeon]